MSLKKGIATTEFWTDIAVAVVVVFDKHLGLDLSPEVKVLVTSIAAVYTVCRSWIKK